MDISSFIDRCLSYPSGDNCQPFRFRVFGDNRFEIFHDDRIGKHRLNLSNRASILSLGALLETVSLTALNDGFAAKFESHVAHVSQEQHLQKWVTVTLEKAPMPINESDKELYKAIPIRAVKRGRYAVEAPSTEILQWLKLEAANNSNIAFSFQSSLSSDLNDTLLSIEEEMWKDLRLAKDVFKWIRFTKQAAEKTRDGMTWRSLGLPFFQKPFMKLFSHFPNLYKLVADRGSTAGQKNMLKDHIKHSSGFGWLALKSADKNQLVSAGRTYFRLWLYLAARGYAFQPMSLATFPAFEAHFHGLPQDWPKILHDYYPRLRELIRRDSNMEAQWVPIWGFRTGRATPLPREARCLRKSFQEVSLS